MCLNFLNIICEKTELNINNFDRTGSRTHVLAGLCASIPVFPQWEKVASPSKMKHQWGTIYFIEKKLNNWQPTIVLSEDTQFALGSPRWGCILQLMKFPSYSMAVLPHSTKHKWPQAEEKKMNFPLLTLFCLPPLLPLMKIQTIRRRVFVFKKNN